MPVIMHKGPLPENHPFSGGRIVIGQKPPAGLKKKLQSGKAESRPPAADKPPAQR